MPNVSQDNLTLRRRGLLLVAAFWAVVVTAMNVGRVADMVHETLTLPVSFRLEEATGHGTRLDPRLRIFNLDDGTYAALKRPSLTGADWAVILGNLAAANPAAVVTTHMFGTGEFDEAALQGVVAALKARGTEVVAAGFAYPGRIEQRAPLRLERSEFQPRRAVTTAPAPGALLYGPDPNAAQVLSAIGHVGYDGRARTAAFLALDEVTHIPHLGLAVASHLAPRIVDSAGIPDQAIDGQGRVVVDFSRFRDYAERSKPLKGLLDPGTGAAYAARIISPGDTVLILTDMYTGKANFVSTPLGPLPGGYVAAAMLSSVLSDHWIDQPSNVVWIACFLMGLCGLIVGSWAEVSVFAVASSVLAIGIPAAGLVAFVYGGTLIAWPVVALAYFGPASTLQAWRLVDRSRSARHERERLAREAAKLSAVVRTSQMFAHDVRKPFSTLKIALQATRLQPDAAAAARYLRAVVPEIERSMAHVEAMIRDVMEIEGTPQLRAESTAVEDLISETFRQVFAVSADAEAQISYRFEQTLDVAVDRSKLLRALINIVDNAVQATDGRGRLWVTARDLLVERQSFVELSLGNSGSYVEPSKREQIFEAFYTSGKPGGTGLGLALARKVVDLHGGSIRCESSRELGTEFIMTLPVAHETPRQRSANLPRSAHEYRNSLAPIYLASDADELTRLLAEGIEKFRATHGRKPRALLLDDDANYREGLRLVLADTGFDVATAHDAHGALQYVGTSDFELVLADLDLGDESPNGTDVVAAIRALGSKAYAVIHLESHLAEAAPSLGRADQFLAKPASLRDLLTAAGAALRRVEPDDGQGTLLPPARPTVAVLDDNVFVLEAWALVAADARILTYTSPAAFWAEMNANPDLLGQLDAVITDLHFGDLTEDGLGFAAALKKRLRVPVFLSTDGILVEALGASVDAQIAKEPVPFADLKRRLRR